MASFEPTDLSLLRGCVFYPGIVSGASPRRCDLLVSTVKAVVYFLINSSHTCRRWIRLLVGCSYLSDCDYSLLSPSETSTVVWSEHRGQRVCLLECVWKSLQT